MITREELLEAAPEGVDYVYWERCESSPSIRIFWYKEDTGWCKFVLGYERSAKMSASEIWHYLSSTAHFRDNELPRRWAAQREPLEKWIQELGLESEYFDSFCEELGLPKGGICYSLTPQQQEQLPQFALQFLKERLIQRDPVTGMIKGPCSVKSPMQPELEDQDAFKTEAVTESTDLYYKIWCKGEADPPMLETPLPCVLINYEDESCNVTPETLALWGKEPPCHCNVNMGHSPDCEWKKWKDKSGLV